MDLKRSDRHLVANLREVMIEKFCTVIGCRAVDNISNLDYEERALVMQYIDGERKRIFRMAFCELQCIFEEHLGKNAVEDIFRNERDRLKRS